MKTQEEESIQAAFKQRLEMGKEMERQELIKKVAVLEARIQEIEENLKPKKTVRNRLIELFAINHYTDMEKKLLFALSSARPVSIDILVKKTHSKALCRLISFTNKHLTSIGIPLIIASSRHGVGIPKRHYQLMSSVSIS